LLDLEQQISLILSDKIASHKDQNVVAQFKMLSC